MNADPIVAQPFEVDAGQKHGPGWSGHQLKDSDGESDTVPMSNLFARVLLAWTADMSMCSVSMDRMVSP
jgi:hypothetical protein